jgi:hypothetical protein
MNASIFLFRLIGAKGFLTLALSMSEDLRKTALDDPDLDAIFGQGKII